MVIPIYGGWEWTARALGALLANTDGPYETILVDDASPDGTADRIAAAVHNVRLVRNARNAGFGASCNVGAALARGQFIVFLNSDALVHDGWLPPLVETARSDPRIGAVGPRFLNVDGSLQEAGALLFADGSTRAYGNGGTADTPEFRRRRLIDYASAACLLVRRSAFNEVGGFDPIYGTGYVEDVDLCLTLAAQGYRVSYDPRALVTHVGGWSPSPREEARALGERNRATLVGRWPEVLAARPPLSERVEDVLAARDAPASDRVLVAAPVRLVRQVARVCAWAHLALIADGNASHSDAEELLPLGVEVVAGDVEQIESSLAARPYHYDVVILASPSHPLGPLIRATQPQASRIVDPPRSDDALADVLADVGVDATRATDRAP